MLGDGRKDRDHQLPGGFQRVDALFFKDDGDVQGFQRPDVVQRVQRVAGETGTGLCDDKVDCAFLAGGDERVELRPGLRLGPAQALVRENARQLLAVMRLYEICVVIHLCLVGTFLFLGVRGHAAVGRGFRDR